MAAHGPERIVEGRGPAETRDERLHIGGAPALAEQEHALGAGTGCQLEAHLVREAGIALRAARAVERRVFDERTGTGGRSADAEEAAAVVRDEDLGRDGRGLDGREGHPVGEDAGQSVAREQRPAVARRLDDGRVRDVLWQPAEHESRVREDREPASRRREVGEAQARQLHGRIGGDERRHLLIEVVAAMAPARRSEAVARLVAGSPGRWPGLRRPEGAGVLVAHPESLAVGIEDGVVRPGREPVLARVAAPRVRGAALGDECAEARVREHVHPGHGREPARLGRAGDVDHVLAAVVR